MIPAWAKGAAQLVGWLIAAPDVRRRRQGDRRRTLRHLDRAWPAILLCGVILTAGPVVYETVETVQFVLVGLIMLIVDRPGGLAGRPAGPTPSSAQVDCDRSRSAIRISSRRSTSDLTPMLLLGALAFAGAGGTMNLCQSNYIRDKGYAMGSHVGRITSPLTGKEEAITEVGYHFPHTPENLRRWAAWWRGACLGALLQLPADLPRLPDAADADQLHLLLRRRRPATARSGEVPRTWASSGPRPAGWSS